jgi:predicted DNA-binding transcriptional regulator AlpA
MKAKPTIKPQLLNAKQLATILSIGRTKVYELKSAGRLPRCIKLDGCVRWRAADIDLWLQSGCPAIDKIGKLKEGGV